MQLDVTHRDIPSSNFEGHRENAGDVADQLAQPKDKELGLDYSVGTISIRCVSVGAGYNYLSN